MALSDTAYEIYSACQLAPGEEVVDAVARIESLLPDLRKQDDALILQLVEALDGVHAAPPRPAAGWAVGRCRAVCLPASRCGTIPPCNCGNSFRSSSS